MNKKHAALQSLMTPDEQDRLQSLKMQRVEILQFRHRIYHQEWFGREGAKLTAAAVTLLLAAIITIGSYFVFSGLSLWSSLVFLVVFVLVPLSYFFVLRQIEKRPSWEALFTEGIQDYAPRALNPSALQSLKATVQSKYSLDFHHVKQWFDEELLSARVRTEYHYAKYEYAWFYQTEPESISQNLEPYMNCGLDAKDVAEQCSTFIDLNEMNRIRNESGK